MNIKIPASNEAMQYAIAAAVVLVAVVYFGKKAAAAAAVVADKVNPASTGNVVYSGVNAIGDIFNDGTNNDDWTLGGQIYDWTHAEYKP